MKFFEISQPKHSFKKILEEDADKMNMIYVHRSMSERPGLYHLAVISSQIFSRTVIFEPFKPESYPTFGSELSQSLSQNLGGAFVPLNGHEDVWVHGPVAYDGRLSFSK